jgi:hypothetical protein
LETPVAFLTDDSRSFSGKPAIRLASSASLVVTCASPRPVSSVNSSSYLGDPDSSHAVPPSRMTRFYAENKFWSLVITGGFSRPGLLKPGGIRKGFFGRNESSSQTVGRTLSP